jgi:hypothetical protein
MTVTRTDEVRRGVQGLARELSHIRVAVTRPGTLLHITIGPEGERSPHRDMLLLKNRRSRSYLRACAGGTLHLTIYSRSTVVMEAAKQPSHE